jgi:endonuclease/exonuclease/phosphatase family metal-dependent hydrolase
MRVMTWNVWWRFGGNWHERQPGIVSTLHAVHPDVLGLQEVWRHDGVSQSDALGAELGMYAAFATTSIPPVPDPPESPDQVGVEMGVALVSRWPLLSTQERELPCHHRDRAVALVAELDHPFGRLHAIVSCSEWEPEYLDDHLAQTEALARMATDPALDGPLPVLLMGDLNAAPDSPQMRPLCDVLVDTWVAGDGDPSAVTLSSAHPAAPLEATGQIDRRIDYILGRSGRKEGELRVDRVFLAGDPVNGLHPSDHFAVVADIAVS